MTKIAILPDILCNQIAAGEVVERPAAVVKELVENSIDAGSSRITVSLLQGGRKEIRVIDNGCGMQPEDALLAIERHATSKIRCADDLHSIHTLGFRGEALPSIASVSRFELVTREHDSLSGIQVRMEGGVLRDVREKGAPAGTQIQVRDLFYNVPVRRKFMRTAETELAYITDQFFRIAMAHFAIHFQLCSHERLIHDFPACTDRGQRAGQVLGPEVSRALDNFQIEKNGIAVTGSLGSPHVQRTNGQSLFLFVNGRPVWDRLLQRTILTAYEALIPKGKFPVAILFVEVPPDSVDVNVHPAKREIRFKNPGEVIELVREGVLGALAAARPKSFSSFMPERPSFMPEKPSYVKGAPSQTGFFRDRQASFNFRRDAAKDIPWRVSGEATDVADAVPGDAREDGESGPVQCFEAGEGAQRGREPSGETAPEEGAAFSFSGLAYIGQLANAFLLLEAPDGLVLIDQHAAHERILFNILSSRRGAGASQLLTVPAVVELMPREAVYIRKWMKSLAAMGFEITAFGGTSFSLRAVPAVLSGISPEEMIRDLLKYVEEEGPANESGLMAGVAKIASCKAAVKAGQKLKEEEVHHLLRTLDNTDHPFTCPHGRPLWFKLSYDQIMRFFKRT